MVSGKVNGTEADCTGPGGGEPLPAGEKGVLAIRLPLPPGFFFILGRTGDVINVSGHRIGTREIEEALCSHPAVAVGGPGVNSSRAWSSQ